MSAATCLAQAVGLEDELRAAGFGELLPLLQPLLDELNRRNGLLFAVDPGDTSAAAFERFWATWCAQTHQGKPVLPRAGKKAARQAFAAAKRELPPLEKLLGAVCAYAGSARVRSGTAQDPERWLKKGRWTDDAATLTAINKGRAGDEPPAGYDWTDQERERWPHLSRDERSLWLENMATSGRTARSRRLADEAIADARELLATMTAEQQAEYDDVTEGDW